MDKKSFIISLVALAVAVGTCVYSVIATTSTGKKATVTKTENGESSAEPIEIAEGSIVYFQLDRILKEYDMANDLSSVVESKMQSIQEQMATRQKKLQKDYDAFNEKIQKGLMTQSTAQAQAEKLEKQKSELEQWANTKQNEMMEEQQVTMNQIMDAVQTFVTAYNEEKGYAMIFANQAIAPIMTANSGLDITDEIIAGLNEEYVKNKNKKD